MTKTFKQFEDLFESYFLNERDTEYAFSNTDKNALLKVVKGYKDYLKGKNTFPSPTYIEGIGIESNDEKIIFSVENLYRLWSKSPYWLQRKKNGETLYVFGISFCEKLNSFIIGGYLENKKGEGRFVAIAWSQPVNTIGFLADAIIADYVPDGVRLKKNTPLYRLFTFACVS
mgnify:CR=1 FL=1